MTDRTIRSSLRLSAALLLVGQLLYIIITQFHTGGKANDHPAIFAAYARSGDWKAVHVGQFHTGGEANDHPAIFAAYARSGDWKAVHVGQFAAMAILLAGLLALFFALDGADGTARWAGRFGAAAAVVALALYGALQAVDGIANKEADQAWVHAPAAEKSARFASAEIVRWIEWGMRSYHTYALGLALLLFAVAVVRTAWLPQPLAYLIGLAGIADLVQGWVVGAEGFSNTNSIAIVVAWVLDVIWMVWLVIVAWRMQEPELRHLADEGWGRPDTGRASSR